MDRVGLRPRGLEAGPPMEQQPTEVTFRRQFGRDRGENFSLPYGVADCAAPPVSKRRSRSGPNLHSGDTHHCADGLFARNKHLVHDSASACSLGLFLARPRAGAPGVETCMEYPVDPLIRGRGPPARGQAPSSAAQYNPLQKEPAPGPATLPSTLGLGVVAGGPAGALSQAGCIEPRRKRGVQARANVPHPGLVHSAPHCSLLVSAANPL